MQTFLPFNSFKRSAAVLDMRRLGKQRVECKQLLLGQWPNHPAAKMWKGYEWHLADYAVHVCREWRSRGYNDSLLPWFISIRSSLPVTPRPSFLGDAAFHNSHRSNLMRKDREYYHQWFAQTPDNLPYMWPIHVGNNRFILIEGKPNV